MEQTLATRYEILEELLAKAQTKPELVSVLSVSRSTVDRGISDLLEMGCVEREGSTYSATESGRLAFREYEAYTRNLETITEATPILNTLDPETIDLQFLRGATIDLPDPRAPWKAFETSMQLVHAANSLTGTAPAVFQRFFEDLMASVRNDGLACELTIDTTLFESFDETELKQLRAIVQADGGSLLVTDLEDSYAIWIADTGENGHAGLTVYGDSGVVGIIHNDDPDAVAWVKDRYRERKETATVVWNFD